MTTPTPAVLYAAAAAYYVETDQRDESTPWHELTRTQQEAYTNRVRGPVAAALEVHETEIARQDATAWAEAAALNAAAWASASDRPVTIRFGHDVTEDGILIFDTNPTGHQCQHLTRAERAERADQ